MRNKFLIACLCLAVFVGVAFAVSYTTYTNIQATGDLLVGDDATIVGDINVAGTATLSGVITTDSVVLDGIIDVAITTPTVVGQLAIDSSYNLYISTATDSLSDWIKVGTQS